MMNSVGSRSNSDGYSDNSDDLLDSIVNSEDNHHHHNEGSSMAMAMMMMGYNPSNNNVNQENPKKIDDAGTHQSIEHDDTQGNKDSQTTSNSSSSNSSEHIPPISTSNSNSSAGNTPSDESDGVLRRNHQQQQNVVKMALTNSFERACNEVESALSEAPLCHSNQEENAKAASIVAKQALIACLNKAVRDWASTPAAMMPRVIGVGGRVAFIGDNLNAMTRISPTSGLEENNFGSDQEKDDALAVQDLHMPTSSAALAAAATAAANAAALAAGEDQIPMSRQWTAEIRSAQVSRTYPRVSYEIYVRLTVFSDLGEAPITGSCVVRRRYRDFARLFNELKSYFLNQACLFVVIPRLPPKGYMMRTRTEPNLVFHRRCALQHWLDYVCSHHLLRNSTALRQFLWQSSTSAVTERASLDTETISATARLQAQMNVRKEAVLAFHAEEAQIVALRKAFRSSAVAHLQMNASVHGLEQTYRSCAKSSRDCRHADAALLIGRRQVAQALKELCDFEAKTPFGGTAGNEYVFLGRFAVGLGNAFDYSSSMLTSSVVSSPSQSHNNNIRSGHSKQVSRNHNRRGNQGSNKRSRLPIPLLEHDLDDDENTSVLGGGGGDSSDEWGAVVGGYSIGTTYEGFLPNPSDSRWREETSFTSGGGILHDNMRDNIASGEDDNRSLSSRISAVVRGALFHGGGNEASGHGSTISTASFFPTVVEAGEIPLPRTPCLYFDCLSLKRFEYMLMLWGNKLFPEVKKGFVHPSASEGQRKVTIRYTDDLIENVPPPRTKTERCAAEWVELGVIRPKMIRDAAMRMVKNQIAHAARERQRWEAIKAELEVDLTPSTLNESAKSYSRSSIA